MSVESSYVITVVILLHNRIHRHTIIIGTHICVCMFEAHKYIYIYIYIYISLSMILLNSRDWSEIVWLPEISYFKINLAISFIRKKPAGMHWLGYNDTVSSLNEAKTQIFQPTANFENFKIRLYFISQPAVRPGCANYS